MRFIIVCGIVMFHFLLNLWNGESDADSTLILRLSPPVGRVSRPCHARFPKRYTVHVSCATCLRKHSVFLEHLAFTTREYDQWQ